MSGGECRQMLAVTLAALLLFTYGLGAGSLWDQDEAKYTQVAAEMLATGDWWTLRWNGEPWFVHPPLFMWLQAATARLVGLTEATARWWSAVSQAVVVGVTSLLGRLLYDARTGWLAAAVAATMLQMVVQARLAVFDPTLLAGMLAALYMGLVAHATASRRAQHWAWAWAGLATSAKGPIGLLLPAVVLVALGMRARRLGIWRASLVTGPLLYAAVGLPWYVVETVRHGWTFLRPVVGYYLITRFVGVVEEQPGPWWYYAPVLAAGAFPWTALALPAGVYLARRASASHQVILLWVGLVVVFYSIAGTKLPNYVLPVYPVLAIGIARFCLDALADAPGTRRLFQVSVGLLVATAVFLVVGLLAFGARQYPAETAALLPALLPALAVLAAGPLSAALLAILGSRRAALCALLLTMVVATPVLVHVTLPAVERQRPIPRLAALLRGQMQPGDALAAVQMRTTPSLVYYAGTRVQFLRTRDDLAQALCAHSRLFVVVPDGLYRSWFAAGLPPDVRTVGQEGTYRLLRKDGPAPCAGTRPASPPRP
ncbi:MAG: glycosyltransferase family 39 protein [Armatimonadota bacterium]|nr:glycosyltransferase family 39 protein [Armatimonadota bacterium]MDR7532429.1 glycosyltransferase family 39 protein [Armatimonadota bacterium]MDR7535652.1 glycosyltransferase family 39 protein [Armatimonadota bacterium]